MYSYSPRNNGLFFFLVLSLFPSFSDDLQDETEESIVKRTVDRLWSSKKWREES